MSITDSVNQYLAAWGRRHNTTLSLNDGVCALVNGDRQEVAVVELPADSDCVLFHCQLENMQATASENRLRMLLALNFEMNAMRGCWLALDGDDCLRLCSQLSVSGLDARTFSQMLEGFITQAQEVSEFLNEIREAA